MSILVQYQNFSSEELFISREIEKSFEKNVGNISSVHKTC
jgi:hypothetical protein